LVEKTKFSKLVVQGRDIANRVQDELPTDHLIVNLGPSHPATHGTLRIILELDGEVVVRTKQEIGYLHRGIEKLGENLTWHQFIPLTDRLNYVSSAMNNVGYCLAVEKLLGIEAPPRAQALRVIVSELSRIADHLVCVTINAVDLGAFTTFLYAFQQREVIYELLESICGARLTTSITRIGGMYRDVDADWPERVRKTLPGIEKTVREVETLLTRNRIWLDRTQAVSPISAADAVNFGFAGPCLRASGVDWDIRKNEPYCGYEQYDFDIPIGTTGDVYDRYLVRMEEMLQSLKIIRQAVDRLPGGPVVADDPKNVMPPKEEVYNTIEGLIRQFKFVTKGPIPPKGEIYSATEAANGELGFYLVSDGKGLPYRLRIRPPCFIYYQAFDKLCRGLMIADIIAVLGSLNIIAGELDR
jgi:NADH dehydrogenase I D subunit